jgi:hypothetical protein
MTKNVLKKSHFYDKMFLGFCASVICPDNPGPYFVKIKLKKYTSLYLSTCFDAILYLKLPWVVKGSKVGVVGVVGGLPH